jgi:hypothetical protein
MRRRWKGRIKEERRKIRDEKEGKGNKRRKWRLEGRG